MEQTALRPKPMPGREPGGGRPAPGTVRRPHAARRRGRRLMTLLFSLFVGAVLVLSGIGLGTVGATVIGMSKLADLRREAGEQGGAQGASGPAQGSVEGPAQGSTQGPGGSKSAPGAGSSASPKNPSRDPRNDSPEGRPTLGVEVVDSSKGPGALLVGVHVPGPGYTAGLVRGDVLLVFGRTRVDSAADLARAVAAARPGTAVTLTLRHASGGYQQLSVTPGVVT
ncbi:membrane-associated protease RseP (regulator of RpoE activity) [Streptomyces umbrinus]|uniref:Membrane-associated protease RseP (Regulator of RpoE activity) n=1 Tax=Streptomyces umbrinus TaxID=67370 RepID=A0ABU0SP66_9ACTN|nr:S1C family serine protease [Streptomyces umbrinus]MDQ1025355.1 membrane-associated protease RseP (regulator of RpoE activity) [Streptomyces umbrinus]